MSWLGICCDRLVNVKRAANTVEDEQVQLLKTVNCFWGKCGGRHFKPSLFSLSLSTIFSRFYEYYAFFTDRQMYTERKKIEPGPDCPSSVGRLACSNQLATSAAAVRWGSLPTTGNAYNNCASRKLGQHAFFSLSLFIEQYIDNMDIYH